jgi:1-acyl-sn-glycerol-3-phosphate acyltransferase
VTRVLYAIGRALSRLLLTVLGRWEVEGRENVPERGGVILAPNHTSYLDPPAAGTAIERPTWFMAKEELFRIPVLGWIIPRTRAFPVRRGAPDRRALRRAMDLLEQGEVVTIFPEGTRSEDGRLKEPELGFALIALKTRAPVVPMALIGTTSVLPYNSPFLRPGKVRVRIGKPITFPDLYDGPCKKPDLEEVGRRVMAEIARLQEGA